MKIKTEMKYIYYLSVMGLFSFIISPFGNFPVRVLIIFMTLIILLFDRFYSFCWINKAKKK